MRAGWRRVGRRRARADGRECPRGPDGASHVAGVAGVRKPHAQLAAGEGRYHYRRSRVAADAEAPLLAGEERGKCAAGTRRSCDGKGGGAFWMCWGRGGRVGVAPHQDHGRPWWVGAPGLPLPLQEDARLQPTAPGAWIVVAPEAWPTHLSRRAARG